MTDCESIDFRLTEIASAPQRANFLRHFLANNQLVMEDDIHTFIEIHCGGEFAGCAGLAGNLIKCVQIDARWRGRNLSGRLLTAVENVAFGLGYSRLFLCTLPANLSYFRRCGFWPVSDPTGQAVLMENSPVGLQRYCRQLEHKRQPGKKIASIVMNANPFTLGHCYLAEQAAEGCDWLHLFVVREDVSFFPYSERLSMVKKGVAHLSNVTVHEGSDYMISRATFPAYFLKEKQKTDQVWSEIDLLIFRNHIAPALGITHRFVGTEPFCNTTRQYNQSMHQLLPGDITVIEVSRLSDSQGVAVSASEVRRLLATQQYDRLRETVPLSTFLHLKAHYGAGSRPSEHTYQEKNYEFNN